MTTAFESSDGGIGGPGIWDQMPLVPPTSTPQEVDDSKLIWSKPKMTPEKSSKRAATKKPAKKTKKAAKKKSVKKKSVKKKKAAKARKKKTAGRSKKRR